MITMISMLKRREDLTFEEFVDWYENHAEAATGIPGLRHYYVNIATSGDQEWDALSMLSFDDEEALESAMNGAAGERSRADTRAHISRREVVYVNRKQIDIPLNA